MMEAKFHQLRPGQRFLWQGSTYEKINPLLARSLDNGAQRMVPRSTLVTRLEGEVAPVAAEPPPPDLAAARRVFEDYHRSSLHWLERQDGSEEKLRQARTALAQARHRVLAALGGKEEETAPPEGNAG
ncbi:hypothetical protein [Sulfurivermis fontis]|uniref:hypothetical protein n=1 Tax=Sulfurivermis fontis TaxID=1972068 RepID=UPI000FD733CC|nr:hypothetical protein [Sulfurivermis fontis]